MHCTSDSHSRHALHQALLPKLGLDCGLNIYFNHKNGKKQCTKGVKFSPVWYENQCLVTYILPRECPSIQYPGHNDNHWVCSNILTDSENKCHYNQQNNEFYFVSKLYIIYDCSVHATKSKNILFISKITLMEINKQPQSTENL